MQHSYEGLDRPGGFSRVGLLAPLRSRNFRLLWSAMTVSLIGDGIFLIAMVWQAYALWNAPAALAVLGIGMTLPTIACLLLGGAISDRLDRRHILLYSDLARALVVGVLAALTIAGALSFALLVVLVALYGVGTAFFTPAFEAIVPDIVPQADLAQANALDQFVRPLALRMVGPALGGWLVAWLGAGPAFALDAASFAVSAGIVLVLRTTRPVEKTHASNVTAIVEGFRFVRQNVWLWGTLASAAIAYLAFLGPTEALLPYLVKNELHASAGDLGLVFAAGGVGAVGAAVLMAQRGHPKRDVTVMYACWTLATLAVAGYGLARSTTQLMLACLVFNALEAAGTIIWATIKQLHVPASLLGRVSSLDWLISIGLLPVSFALTAPAADLIGVRTTLLVAAVVGSAATFGALFIPGMRAIEDTEPLATRAQERVAPPSVAAQGVSLPAAPVQKTAASVHR
jgi:DHA3 family tetracycline resistance protein-like MFS transporter